MVRKVASMDRAKVGSKDTPLLVIFEFSELQPRPAAANPRETLALACLALQMFQHIKTKIMVLLGNKDFKLQVLNEKKMVLADNPPSTSM